MFQQMLFFDLIWFDHIWCICRAVAALLALAPAVQEAAAAGARLRAACLPSSNRPPGAWCASRCGCRGGSMAFWGVAVVPVGCS